MKITTVGVIIGLLLSLGSAKCRGFETHEKSMSRLIGGIVGGYVAGEAISNGFKRLKEDYRRRLKELDKKKKERESKKKKGE